MRRRFLHGAAVAALAVLVGLIIWQGSFSFGDLAPANPTQTSLFWAVSTLVFLLTVTLGFMLFRTAARLYVERRSGVEGSRIKTKLVVGALGLTTLPVFFLVLWGVYVLNRNLDKWFSRPAEGIKANLVEAGRAMEREASERVRAQALWLASLPEIAAYARTGVRPEALFQRWCRDHHLNEAYILRPDGVRLPVCGAGTPGLGIPGEAGFPGGVLRITGQRPPELEAAQQEISRYVRTYDQLVFNRKNTRNFYLLLLALITLFILFVAAWIALFLARQISVPITALLEAAGEVRRGNLRHRVPVKAMDELAALVRAFNEMTEALEENRRELEARRRFTEAILESIPTGVISLSADGRILKVNRALEQILGPERLAAAERLEDLFSREDTADLKHLMRRARRTGAVSASLEMATPRGRLPLSVTVSALETKLTSGFVIVLEDTSELLRAQKAEAWREVAQRIAHEIKNPLTPITLSAQRIARHVERSAVPEDLRRIVQECTGAIVQETESLKSLLEAFSQFARFPAARPEPADLNEVVEHALAVFAGRLEGIEVERNLAPDLPPVAIDREQFKRVIINLVDNAAEAMRDSLVKRLSVLTHSPAPETVELIVADTGCGISPEAREKLFLPYFSTKGRGTGLGLAIVSHIVAEHNAHIRVEDNRPVGARFIIELPALVAETARRPAEAGV
ncbi:MAG TPA: ATP-binding protein [Bryobacteraceae bacterium]|nr:ATP-binding protein [Bryobacteraceae bacterium]